MKRSFVVATVAAAAGSARVERSGIRIAASSPATHALRASASRFVAKEPAYRDRDSRPPTRYSTRKRTPRVPCRRSIQQLAIAGAPLSATASEHSDWAAGPEAARIVATCSRGVWVQSTHARSYASDRTWASGRAGNPSPPEGRGIGDAKDRPGNSAFADQRTPPATGLTRSPRYVLASTSSQ